MKKMSLAIASALLIASGASFGASISINPAAATAQPGAGNPTSPATIDVFWDNSGLPAGEGDSIDATVQFDDTKLSVSVTGDCAVNGGDPGEVIIATFNVSSNTIPSGALCTMTFTTLAGAADGDVVALDLDNVVVGNNGAPLGTQPPANDGVINILSTPIPLTLSVDPLPAFPAGNIGATSAAQPLTVTATGNQGAASLTACTAPAGIGLSPTSLNFAAAGTQAIDVTCTYAAAAINGNISCIETDGDSNGTPRNIPVSCPAGAVVPVTPTITSSPTSGSTTAIPGGLVGSTRSTLINFTNTGGAGSGSATIDCSTAAPLSINPTGLQTVTGSDQPTDITVSCTLAEAEQSGTVTCAIEDAGGTRTDTFDFTCPAGSTFIPPPSPEVVPASSLWSKLGLIGLLAALGMLVVGFRRNH